MTLYGNNTPNSRDYMVDLSNAVKFIPQVFMVWCGNRVFADLASITVSSRFTHATDHGLYSKKSILPKNRIICE